MHAHLHLKRVSSLPATQKTRKSETCSCFDVLTLFAYRRVQCREGSNVKLQGKHTVALTGLHRDFHKHNSTRRNPSRAAPHLFQHQKAPFTLNPFANKTRQQQVVGILRFAFTCRIVRRESGPPARRFFYATRKTREQAIETQ